MKSVVTGMCCLSLVAVLATLSLGDGNSPPEGQLEFEVVIDDLATESVLTDVPVEDFELKNLAAFDLHIVDDGEAVAGLAGDDVEATADVLVEGFSEGPAPKVIRLRGHRGGAEQKPRVVVSRTMTMNSAVGADSETREALEKLAHELAEQAASLEKEGRKDEAEKKRKASEGVRAISKFQGRTGTFVEGGAHRLKNVINVVPAPGTDVGVRKTVRARVAANGPEFQEIRELEAKLAALKAESDKAASSLTGEKLAEVTKDLELKKRDTEKVLDDRRQKLKAYAFVQAGAPAVPGAPMPPVAHPGAHGEASIVMFHEEGHPAAMRLKAKSKALLKASQALKAAGKHDEAKRLMEESEELKRAHKAAQDESGHFEFTAQAPGADVLVFNGQPVPGLGGPGIHGALKELQEQIQQLRKEVAELKEMLKK